MTTAWAQLLHFYQPPTQTHDVLRRVVEESYRPLLAVFARHPQARLAVNMNAVLTEMLDEHGYGDVLDGLRSLAERGQVEFVGSARYHPILPLIPPSERERSIRENAMMNHRLFGGAWKPRGFFAPELCYSADLAPEIARSGHEWLLLSGVACPEEWPIDSVYRVPANGRTLHVLFRDDSRSNGVSFRETDPAQFLENLGRVGAHGDAYVVTAMDAETYGHHIRGWEEEFLGRTYELIAAQQQGESSVEVFLPSDLLKRFPSGPEVEPLASSWSTTRDDIDAKNPYPLWHSPGNPVHEWQWEYVGHCLELVSIAQRYAANEESKRFAGLASDRLQPALHSCQFWWASRRPMWDVPMIYRGLVLLSEVVIFAAKSVRTGEASESVKREAGWRLAAANEARWKIEQELVGDSPS